MANQKTETSKFFQFSTLSSSKVRTDWKKRLNYRWIVKNVPFFLFLAVLTVLYIANGHYADKTYRKITSTSKHIKELEFEYKTVKRDVIFRSKASELAKAVEPLGLRELTKPPMKLGSE